MDITNSDADFTLLQCREALADFDQATIEQAIHVVTCGKEELIQKAARDPDLGRVVFWVKQWMAVERIQSCSEAFSRLRVVPSIRRERQHARRSMLMGWNAVLGFSLYLSSFILLFNS